MSKRYCIPCDKVVPARERECKACGADTDPWPDDEPERTAWDDDYDRAERSDEWERRGGGGL